jgi:putative endonuclease
LLQRAVAIRKVFYLYVLLCADGSYYTGMTSNIERRIGEHQCGAYTTCYTYKRRPVRCVYVEEFSNFGAAMQAGKRLKKWSRAKKRAFIERRFDEVSRLAKRGSRLTSFAPHHDGAHLTMTRR